MKERVLRWIKQYEPGMTEEEARRVILEEESDDEDNPEYNNVAMGQGDDEQGLYDDAEESEGDVSREDGQKGS